MFHAVAAVLMTCIFGLPILGLAGLASVLPDAPPARAAFLLLSPMLYGLGFVLTAGLSSMPFHRSIVAGSFPRDLRVPAYRNRRLYGLCWTAVYYFTPLYWAFLTIPVLRRLLFRLFGYRGQMAFTVYPDTWIRDLPLLELGEGAYAANKATLGTNVCLNDGTILVDRIVLGKGAMVGHMSMLAPGVRMDEGAEVGVGCAIGMRVHLEAGVSVGGCCDVSHLTRMEAGASTGTSVNVGAGCRIGPRVHLPAGVFVPNRSRWRTDAEAAAGLAALRGGPTDAAAPLPPSPGPQAAASGATPEFRTHWNAFE